MGISTVNTVGHSTAYITAFPGPLLRKKAWNKVGAFWPSEPQKQYSTQKSYHRVMPTYVSKGDNGKLPTLGE